MQWVSEPDNMSLSGLLPLPPDCDEPCSLLLEGPPPDAILTMPPPPLPSFMLTKSSLLDLTNGTCGHACLWASLEETGLVEVRRATPAVEDMWTILILSTTVGIVLTCALLVLIILRCREPKAKPGLDECKKTERSVTPPEVAVYARIDPLPLPPPTAGDNGWPKSLWSGIRVGEPSLYSLEHRPFQPQPNCSEPHTILPPQPYEYVDYGSVGQTCAKFLNSDASLSSSSNASPTPLNGRSEYAVLEGSFENSGYVDSDDPSRTSTPVPRVRRLAPDGAVLSPPGIGPIYVGGKDLEIIKQRFSNSLRSARVHGAHELPPPPLPPPRSLLERNSFKTSSPMV